MSVRFIPGGLLGHIYELEDGTRVTLRLARGGDLRQIAALLAEDRGGACELSASRLVQFDPRREYVMCATSLRDGRELLLGVGMIELHQDARPRLLLADGAPGELEGLLTGALIDSARTISRSRAA